MDELTTRLTEEKRLHQPRIATYVILSTAFLKVGDEVQRFGNASGCPDGRNMKLQCCSVIFEFLE